MNRPDPSPARDAIRDRHGEARSPFVARVVLVAMVGALAYAVWTLSDILLLGFGAILIALGLDLMAGGISRWTGLSRRTAVLVGLLVVIVVVAAVFTVFGGQIYSQLRTLSEQLPTAVGRIITAEELKGLVDQMRGTPIGGLVSGVLAWGAAFLGGVAAVVLVVATGVHLAMEPARYRDGFLALVPTKSQPVARDVLDRCASDLRSWFGGQLVAMVIVGAMTMAGLWLIGVPAYLGLGLIAGLTEFVPYIGPIAGAAPAVLLAASDGVAKAGWVVLLFVVIQQLENNVILPLIMGKAADVPPAIGILGTVALGVLLGPLGLLFGFPLIIVILAVVRRLYVEGVLEKATQGGDNSER
ncbi:MAG: AI-2E family transporter [Hyphomicrobiaceae bacterium]